MTYGIKRGIKAPGDYKTTDLAGLALAGSAGIIAAIVTDYQQQGEASSLYTINRWVATAGEILGFANPPLWAIVIGLMAAGGLSIFYFQPITRQGAFAQGFGLLAALMTAAPTNLAGGIEPTSAPLPDLQPAPIEREARLEDGIVNATFSESTPTPTLIQYQQGARYIVELTIVFPEALPADVDTLIRRGGLRGRLHNKESGETFNLFRTAGGDLTVRGNTLVVRAGVPATTNTAELWVRIECEGHAIEVQSAKASVDQPLNWTINVRKSTQPLWMQRLQNSYWF